MAESRPSEHGAPGPNAGWAVLGTLMSGLVVWGGIGWLVDRWLDWGPWAMMIGLLVGSAASIYLIVKRFGAT